MYAERKGCYCGEKGTWLVLKGGPLFTGKTVEPRNFVLEPQNREYVFNRGILTAESYPKYHTEKGLPEAANRESTDYEKSL
jgi:hypothetical protein